MVQTELKAQKDYVKQQRLINQLIKKLRVFGLTVPFALIPGTPYMIIPAGISQES